MQKEGGDIKDKSQKEEGGIKKDCKHKEVILKTNHKKRKVTLKRLQKKGGDVKKYCKKKKGAPIAFDQLFSQQAVAISGQIILLLTPTPHMTLTAEI